MLYYFRRKRNQYELIILKSFIEDLVFALVLERWAQFQYICHTKDLYWFNLDAEKEAKGSFQVSCKDNLGDEVSLWEKDVMQAGLREEVENLVWSFWNVVFVTVPVVGAGREESKDEADESLVH